MESLGPCELIIDDSITPDISCKGILIGEAGVGKTCILHRLVSNEFKEDYEVTIGAEFSAVIAKVQGRALKLQVWDTAGQENFRSMIRVFYKGSHAAFLTFDITRKETFDKLEEWIADIRENALPDVRIFLIGNRRDEEDSRQIPTDTAKDFVTKFDLVGYYETSAKSGEGIQELFVEAAKNLYLSAGDFRTEPKVESVDSSKAVSGQKLSGKSTKDKKGCC
eukprot:TRINITY_DN9418_c0_g3_i1.p2 TRINITY_DN9418_c0_g3~~TRINITY_DN9418_c0_g3_i1.p2  ORF type:complete len:222 (+),score=55.29 TRINITY_DN9418_c0_g3_i1:97-762(+)